MSNLNRMIDRIEQIRELSRDVKYSSLDIGCEIESTLEDLEKVVRQQLAIKESVLLRNWNHETRILA